MMFLAKRDQHERVLPSVIDMMALNFRFVADKTRFRTDEFFISTIFVDQMFRLQRIPALIFAWFL